MALKAEGIWGCTVLGGKAGENDKGIPNVQINVQIDEGPSAGMRATYEDEVNARTAKYVGWSLKAVGWTGGSLRGLEQEIADWIAKTGGKTTVEIKHLEIKNGKNAGKIWDKVNGLGRGARPLKPMTSQSLSDADEAMRMAMGDIDSPPPDDVPPPNDDDRLPF